MAFVTRVQPDIRKVVFAAPRDHLFHQGASDTAPAIVLLDVHVQDHGAMRPALAQLSRPGADHDSTTPDNLAIGLGDESSIGAVSDGGVKVFVGGEFHDGERGLTTASHVEPHGSAVV